MMSSKPATDDDVAGAGALGGVAVERLRQEELGDAHVLHACRRA